MSSSRRDVLAALEAADGYVSGARLARSLGVSRAAVWKHVDALKRDGYPIESGHARGYRLDGKPDRLALAAQAPGPATRWLGHSSVFHETTGSTNSDAMALGREGAAHGLIVAAEEQSAGRGRLGRIWESARGINLYLSILLRPAIVPAQAPQLSLVAGVAVAEAIRSLGIDARIKWPNDVIVGKRKICGVLTEIAAETDRVQFVVVGIGVNLNSEAQHFPEELRSRATSVRIESGEKVDRAAFLRSLLESFEGVYDRYDADGFAAVAPDWRKHSAMDGLAVTVDSPGGRVSGTCTGIDADGALLVAASAGTVRVVAGDVTLEGVY